MTDEARAKYLLLVACLFAGAISVSFVVKWWGVRYAGVIAFWLFCFFYHLLRNTLLRTLMTRWFHKYLPLGTFAFALASVTTKNAGGDLYTALLSLAGILASGLAADFLLNRLGKSE